MGGRKRGSRVFVRLGVWIALLLGLVGCGGEAVAARRLQHEAPKLVKRYIVRELNRRIRENQGGGLVFLAPDSQSLLIAGEAGRHFRMLPGPCGELREFEFARNYIAAHLQYEIAEIVFGRLQSFPDGDNAFSADLTVRLVLRETLWENVPGYPLYGAVLAGSVSPEALETRCRTEYDALLPPPELDYAAIRNSPGRVTVRQLDAVLPADYDPSLPGWRLRDAGGERDDRIQAPSAVRFDLEDWRLPAGLRRRGDKCYFKSGAELLQKYDDHLVWRQGEWRDRAEVEASERLEKAFRQWLRSGEITPDGCAALLTAAEQSARARNRDAVMSRVAGRLTTHCRELAEKDRLRELENWNRILRSGGVWRLLPETAAAEAEAGVAAVREGRRKALATRRARLRRFALELQNIAAKNDSMVRLRIVTERGAAQLEAEYGNAVGTRFRCAARLFAAAHAVLRDEFQEAERIFRGEDGASELRRRENELIEPCPFCRNGSVDCGNCGDAGCPKCGGRGLGKDGDICPECRGSGRCRECGGRKTKPCPACSGRGFAANRRGAAALRDEALRRLLDLLRECGEETVRAAGNGQN